MYKNIIEELKVEINNAYLTYNKEYDKIQKEWIKFSYDKPKHERRLEELKVKCENLEKSNVADLEEKSDLEIKLANYYDQKRIKEEYIERLKDDTKTAIRYFVKRRIAQMIELSINEKEQGLDAAKKMYESNSELDLKAVAVQVKAYDRFVEALEKINKYNGCIRTDSFCENLIKEHDLDEYFSEIIKELYLIIVGQLLDMRKEVPEFQVSKVFIDALEKLQEEKKALEQEKTEETIEESVEEQPLEIAISEETAEVEEVTEVDVLEEVEEQVTEEDTKVEEMEEQATEEIEETNETEEVTEEVLEQEIEENVEEQVSEEEITEVEAVVVDYSDEEARFLELCNYVKENLTQENLEDLNAEYLALQEESDVCEECYRSLVSFYNSSVENKSKNLVTKNTLDNYSKTKILAESIKRPITLIKNSKFAEKKVYKKMEKTIDKALKYTKTSNEYVEKMEKAKVLESKIIKKYIIKDVKLFKSKNKLADMKLKLYGNNNEFSSKRLERKFNKEMNKFAKRLEPKLDGLTNRKLKNDSEECICLILNQYLDLISNCHIEHFERLYTKYSDYLYSVEEKVGQDYFNAFKMAGMLINDYRTEYKLPYDLMKYNLDTGEVYNEIEDIIEFYQFDIEEQNKNILFIKRS